MAKKQIKCVFIEPNKKPEIITIENSLESLQARVGGWIEIIGLADGIDLVCNDEGKLIGLEPNRRLPNDIVCGNMLIVGCNKRGDTIGLTDKKAEYWAKYFNEIPLFNPDDVYEPEFSIMFW